MKVKAFNSTQSDTVGKFRKEHSFKHTYQGIAFIDGKFKVIVDLRIYRTDSRCYAAVWVFPKVPGIPTYIAYGGGWAGGSGYGKESVAAENALGEAGVTFSQHWGGSGMTHEAVTALTKYLIPEGTPFDVIRCHG